MYIYMYYDTKKHTDGGTKKCREGDRQFGPVSSLVMVATPAPWCHVSGHFYDIHTLWNKTGCKLVHRSELSCSSVSHSILHIVIESHSCSVD